MESGDGGHRGRERAMVCVFCMALFNAYILFLTATMHVPTKPLNEVHCAFFCCFFLPPVRCRQCVGGGMRDRFLRWNCRRAPSSGPNGRADVWAPSVHFLSSWTREKKQSVDDSPCCTHVQIKKNRVVLKTWLSPLSSPLSITLVHNSITTYI